MPVRRQTADHVIGVFPRTALSGALAATHRAGFGPQTRVLDGVRGDVMRQLTRAGLAVVAGDHPAADSLLIVVTAPGRTTVVSDLFSRLGAESVLLAARRDKEHAEPAQPALLVPDVRLADETGMAPEA